MKVTPTKIIKQLLKKKIFNPQQFLNKKFFFISVALILLTFFSVYFLKPFYFYIKLLIKQQNESHTNKNSQTVA